jgi:hypothetical protein
MVYQAIENQTGFGRSVLSVWDCVPAYSVSLGTTRNHLKLITQTPSHYSGARRQFAYLFYRFVHSVLNSKPLEYACLRFYSDGHHGGHIYKNRCKNCSLARGTMAVQMLGFAYLSKPLTLRMHQNRKLLKLIYMVRVALK